MHSSLLMHIKYPYSYIDLNNRIDRLMIKYKNFTEGNETYERWDYYDIGGRYSDRFIVPMSFTNPSKLYMSKFGDNIPIDGYRTHTKSNFGIKSNIDWNHMKQIIIGDILEYNNTRQNTKSMTLYHTIDKLSKIKYLILTTSLVSEDYDVGWKDSKCLFIDIEWYEYISKFIESINDNDLLIMIDYHD